MDNLNESAPVDYKLIPISEVVQGGYENTGISTITDWIKEYLACPHSQLGRSGNVCPFIPVSLKMDSISIVEVNDSNPSFEKVSKDVSYFRDLFLVNDPTIKPNSNYKAFILFFSSIAEGDEMMVDQVQYELKKSFIDVGLMLGEFHAENQSPGLHNSEFRPLRSPFPILAIRHMIVEDLPFLIHSSHSASDRVSFLCSYLKRFRNRLKQKKVQQVLDNISKLDILARVTQD